VSETNLLVFRSSELHGRIRDRSALRTWSNQAGVSAGPTAACHIWRLAHDRTAACHLASHQFVEPRIHKRRPQARPCRQLAQRFANRRSTLGPIFRYLCLAKFIQIETFMSNELWYKELYYFGMVYSRKIFLNNFCYKNGIGLVKTQLLLLSFIEDNYYPLQLKCDSNATTRQQ